MCKSLTIPEVIEIVSKMWASTADIMALGCVGESNALDVKRKIRDRMIAEGKAVPRYHVDMGYVMEHYGITKKNLAERMDLIKFLGGVANGK